MTAQGHAAAPARRGGILRAALYALVAALVANNLIRLIAIAVLNPDPGFLPLSDIAPTQMFTTFGVIGATLVYAALRRFTSAPQRIFPVVAWVALALSVLPNLMVGLNPQNMPVTGVTWPNVIALMLMHIPPAYFSVRFLTKE
jgi:hypothetical protein